MPPINENAVNRHIGQLIRSLRVHHGQTQSNLGFELGLTFQQVQKYERGTNKVSASTLIHIAEYYSVDLNYFTSGLDEEELGTPVYRECFDSIRLRLEIGRALASIVSRPVLRGFLTLLRSISNLDAPESGFTAVASGVALPAGPPAVPPGTLAAAALPAHQRASR